MNQRPPDVPPEADIPNRRKVQRIASAALYAVMVALAIWVIRDFVPAIAWACVIAIALWPAFHRIEEHRLFKGRSTLIATVLTIAIGLLFLLPVGIGIAQAAAEAHDVIEWARDVQENGIPLPDFVQHLPFGAAQIGAWWQDNLTQPLRDSPAMKGLHGGAVVTFGRHFGARAAHALMLFGFMLVTLFVIFQAGPKLSGELMKGMRRAFGYDGMHLAERMAAAVRGTVSGLVVVGIGEGALLLLAYMLTGVQHAALPKGSLRLADLGFYDLGVLAALSAADVYWLSKLEPNAVITDEQQRCSSLLAFVQALGALAQWEGRVWVGKGGRGCSFSACRKRWPTSVGGASARPPATRA